MIVLVIVLIWVFFGLLTGILSYYWDMKCCPTRRTTFIFGFIGPFCLFLTAAIICEKIGRSVWWDQTIC